tara:strand:- start:1591 stop:2652 length:1062 start_codon:yes stop_codon:yes gene_type:complete
MAYTTIDKSTDYFTTHLYSGNDSTNNQTSLGMTPDLVWVKCRNHATPSHYIVDKIRGDEIYISSNNNSGNNTDSNTFELVSGGFNLAGGNGWTNVSGRNYASWNWKAGTTGSGSTTGSGTSKTYNYSVNTTAGFSIVKYTGNGSAGHTIPHHLGVAPKCILFKQLTGSNVDWRVYHHKLNSGVGNTHRLCLNDNSTQNNDDSAFNDTSPTSTVFTVGGSTSTNPDGYDVIAYCFAEIPGYSCFPYWIGNGSSSAPAFIYTGFKPKFVIVKCINDSDDWFMHDDKRDGYNDDNEYLFASITNVEGTNTNRIRLLSNGFSVPTTDKSHNQNGNEYIALAFGQTLVGTNNVPCTAR